MHTCPWTSVGTKRVRDHRVRDHRRVELLMPTRERVQFAIALEHGEAGFSGDEFLPAFAVAQLVLGSEARHVVVGVPSALGHQGLHTERPCVKLSCRYTVAGAGAGPTAHHAWIGFSFGATRRARLARWPWLCSLGEE